MNSQSVDAERLGRIKLAVMDSDGPVSVEDARWLVAQVWDAWELLLECQKAMERAVEWMDATA